ncbi:MAG: hypothetical protein H7338_03975 [Candidatus Sericytochromatia bacterium]|nr:hypothetical protein [Candidatus Sericytochromatia bacterium]
MGLLFALGLLLMLGHGASRLAVGLRLPAVTGYIVGGAGGGWLISHYAALDTAPVLALIQWTALAFIFFWLGEELQPWRLRQGGRAATVIAACDVVANLVLVGGLVMWATGSPALGIILGTIAMTTDPVATLWVLRESRAKGPVSQLVASVLAIKSVMVVLCFTIALPLVEVLYRTHGLPTDLHWFAGALTELAGSVLLGGSLALVWMGLGRWVASAEDNHLPLIALILIGASFSSVCHLSLLLTMLVFGAIAATSGWTSAAYHTATRSQGPILAILLVLSGATLHVTELGHVGLLGLVYVIARPLAMVFGSQVGARLAGLPKRQGRLLGQSLVSQAGMSVALAVIVQQRLPEIGDMVVLVVLAAAVIFEITGPLLARQALLAAGEAQQRVGTAPLRELIHPAAGELRH